MNWLTPEYIKEQSQISDEAALECSIEHWQQIYDAPVEEIIKAYQEDKVHTGVGFCSLCQRHYKNCDSCVLVEITHKCDTGTVYGDADLQMEAITDGKTTDKDKIKAMLDLLISLRKDKKMSEFKVGDKVKACDGSFAFGIKNGKYVTDPCCGGQIDGTVASVRLNVARESCDGFRNVCDVLIDCGKNGMWFMQSELCRNLTPVPEKTVTLEVPESMAEKFRDEINRATGK